MSDGTSIAASPPKSGAQTNTPDLFRESCSDQTLHCENGRLESPASFPREGSATCEFRVPKVSPENFLKAFLGPPERLGDLGRLGDFHIRGVLGAGGMGVVLQAEDATLHRQAAIKLMLPETAARPGAAERFLREARAAAAVEHPRVVVIHHVGQWNGAPYLVMPLMAGCSLAARIKNGPPIGRQETVRLAREAAEGLAAAHARGLIHRDIKPDNLWLEETSAGTHVRLLDFGLARGGEQESQLTQPGSVVGTPNYMAPEQAAGEAADGRSDLFSLGCVLYELLTGQKAFAGETLLSVLHALVNHHPPPVSVAASQTPKTLSDLVMRLLEKSPERRPASAGDLVGALEQIERELDETDADVTIAMPKSGAELASGSRITPHVSRPIGLWVAGAIIVLSIAGLIGWTVTHDDDLQPRPLNRSRSQRGASQESSQSATAVATPLRVIAIEVTHFASTPKGDIPRGVLGRRSFNPLLGDRVQVSARLSRPSYAYLIAFRPDGVADVCYPADERTTPPLTDTPRYPASDGAKAYGLREGTGLWVFAVVASDTPLPAFGEWRQSVAQDLSAWRQPRHLSPGIVWWDDGAGNVDYLDAAGVSQTLRGKDERLEGPAENIVMLTNWLRKSTGADTASALGFAVTPPE